METKPTPGPWKVQRGEVHRNEVYSEDDGSIVARIGTPRKPKNTDERQAISDANARLVAAAPDLLAAIEALGVIGHGYCFCAEERDPSEHFPHEPECAAVRAAIAKARGGS